MVHADSEHFLWAGHYIHIGRNQLLCLGVPSGAAKRGENSDSLLSGGDIFLCRKISSGA